MDTLRSVVRNTSILALGQIISKPLQVIYVAILARYVHEEGIGQITIAQAWCALAFVFVNQGLDTLVTRDVAADKSRSGSYLAAVSVIKLVLGLVTVGFLFAVAGLASFSTQTRMVILLYSLVSLSGAIYGTTRAVYQAHERMVYDVGLQLGRDLLNIVLSLVAICLSASLVVIVAVSLLATLIQLILAWPLLHRLNISAVIRPKVVDLLRIFSMALPFSAFVLVAIAGSQVTTVILSVTASQREMGLYGAAQTVLSALVIFPSMFSTAVFPVFSRLSSESGRLSNAFQRSFELMIIVGFPMAALVFLMAGPVLKLLYGSHFTGAVPVLQLLALVLAGMSGFACGTYLNASGRQKLYAMSYGVFQIIQIALSLILIPRFGIIGAVVSVLIFSFMTLVYYTVICYRFTNLPFPWVFSIKVLSATVLVAFGAGFALQQGLHFFLVGLISVLFYGGLILLFQVISIKEAAVLWRALLPRMQPGL